MFYNTSIGSIHPALQKLAQQGCVTVQERPTGQRAKKVYTRTAKGADVFQEWINEPIANLKLKDESMLRLFYFGHIDGDVSEYLERYVHEAEQWIHILEAMMHAQDIQSVPQHLKKIAFFQLATMRYGIDTLKYSREWYIDLIKQYRAEFG